MDNTPSTSSLRPNTSFLSYIYISIIFCAGESGKPDFIRQEKIEQNSILLFNNLSITLKILCEYTQQKFPNQDFAKLRVHLHVPDQENSISIQIRDTSQVSNSTCNLNFRFASTERNFITLFQYRALTKFYWYQYYQ